MWTIKTKILFTGYRIFAAWLPSSQHSALSKKLRASWAKQIVSFCGNNVNFERFSFFTPDLCIGDNSGIGIHCEVYGPVVIGRDVLRKLSSIQAVINMQRQTVSYANKV